MTLPTPLAADLLAYERGDMDDDFDRCMEFLGEMARQSSEDVPWRIAQAINKAVTEGYLSPAGDRQVRGYELAEEGFGSPNDWHVSTMLDR